MSNDKIESIAQVEKMLEEISKNGIDNFSHEELVCLNKMIAVIKEKKLDATLCEMITKKALTGLF